MDVFVTNIGGFGPGAVASGVEGVQAHSTFRELCPRPGTNVRHTGYYWFRLPCRGCAVLRADGRTSRLQLRPGLVLGVFWEMGVAPRGAWCGGRPGTSVCVVARWLGGIQTNTTDGGWRLGARGKLQSQAVAFNPISPEIETLFLFAPATTRILLLRPG